jgi:two-component system NarL family sensor kinase
MGLWLTYRWLSLLPGLWWLLASSPDALVLPLLLLLAAAGSTLIITSLIRFFNFSLTQLIGLVGGDIGVAVGLLLLSGDTTSPYYWYALSPLLLAAGLFGPAGAALGAAGFTLLYLPGLLFLTDVFTITTALTPLFTQLVGVWLGPLLLGYVSARFKYINQGVESPASAGDNQERRFTELALAYQQLQIIHDLTVMLQGASDSAAVQQRVLRVITQELGFNRAAVGRVCRDAASLGDWQIYPTGDPMLSSLPPVPLSAQSSLLARQVLEQQTCWWHNQEPLLPDESLNDWLAQNHWLILPLALPEAPVGVLLLAIEDGPGSLSEDRLVVLSAVASQAAAALGAVERTRRLAAEQERNRIARDIHDTVAQSLFGMVFSLDACIKMMPHQAEAVQQELVELRQVADDVRHEVRRSILDTWPSELTTEQFKADLSKYVDHCSPAHAFKIDFTINGDFDRLPSAIRRTLYRISQEALANSARYAGVDLARLTMHVEPAHVFLSISDHGRGFDPRLALAREVNREHFGLRGIRERVEAMGGVCDILSQVGQGSQILVRLPINGRSQRG